MRIARQKLRIGGQADFFKCGAHGNEVIERFVAETPTARLVGTPEQLWPGVRAVTDGFYYASLTKAAPT